MTVIINIILLILMLGIIILVHELGHFLFAKLFKVYIHEFAIGMGPKLFEKEREGDETRYTIRALPIGGFNAIAGEEEGIEEDKDVPKDMLLYNKPIWQRAIILAAGSVFNFILAVIFIFSFGIIKGPVKMDSTIYKVMKDSPAEKAGIKDGDKIYSINGKRTKTSDDVQLRIFLTVKDAGKKAPVMYLKKAKDAKPVKLVAEKKEVDGIKGYFFGLSFKEQKDKGFLAPFRYTYKKTGSAFRQMFATFEILFKGGLGLKDLSGPVGMYAVVDKSKAVAGMSALILLTAVIAINVGLINLFPIPAFDGGHLMFLLIELIRGKPVKGKIKNTMATIFFILMIILSVIVLFSDIGKLK